MSQTTPDDGLDQTLLDSLRITTPLAELYAEMNRLIDAELRKYLELSTPPDIKGVMLNHFPGLLLCFIYRALESEEDIRLVFKRLAIVAREVAKSDYGVGEGENSGGGDVGPLPSPN